MMESKRRRLKLTAVGDVTNAWGYSIIDDGYLTIQPPSGEEWVIHNIYSEDSVDLYFTDGTDSILFDSELGAATWSKQAFHVTNTHYIQVKNVSGYSTTIGYDGIVTKVAA